MNKLIRDKIWLFRLSVKKDPEAFGKVYDEYVNRIYRFIYFKVSSPEEAQDIASETFLRAWQYIQEGKSIKQLSAFLYSIARNLVIDHYRRKVLSLNAEEAETAGLFSDKVDHKVDLKNKIETNRDFSSLLIAMKKMKEEYREIVQLKYLDELSVGEIAEILGKTKGAVRVTLHRASKTLREICDQDKK